MTIQWVQASSWQSVAALNPIVRFASRFDRVLEL